MTKKYVIIDRDGNKIGEAQSSPSDAALATGTAGLLVAIYSFLVWIVWKGIAWPARVAYQIAPGEGASKRGWSFVIALAIIFAFVGVLAAVGQGLS